MTDEAPLTIERTQLAGAVEDAEGAPIHLKADDTTGSLRVCLFVWDSGETEWVKQPLMDMAALTTAIEALTAAIEAM